MMKKFAAATSTAALALGILATGAGVAGAQEDPADPPASGSASGSLDLGKIVSDLDLANQALNGPVSVEPTENGATVSYTNKTEDAQKCGGMVFPYASIADADVDMSNPIALATPIEEGGDVTIVSADADGKPSATPLDGSLAAALIPFAFGGGGVDVAAGKSVTWTVDNDKGPFAAAILCGSLDEINFGIDKQVVADQINGKIPGGSLDPVGAGSISGGSVNVGATALGSLAGGGDDTEPTDPPTAG